MPGMESLDVMIGIITIYLIFALACTAIVEALSSWQQVRSTNLKAALGEFLHGEITDGQNFTKAFMSHPLVQSLSNGTDRGPSYIPPEIAGQVVANLILRGDKDESQELSLKQAIANLPGTPQGNRIKGLLGALQSEAKDDIETFRKLVEQQYDRAMDRASGWYKRHTQRYALIISAILVVSANVDTLKLVNSLSSNPAARAKMVEIAQREVDAANKAVSQVEPSSDKTASAKSATNLPPPGNANTQDTSGSAPVTQAINRSTQAAKELEKANADLSSTGIQLGWTGKLGDYVNLTISNPVTLVSKIIGLLVSILAVALGAPFWFDTLNRVMQIRAAGTSPRNAQKKAP